MWSEETKPRIPSTFEEEILLGLLSEDFPGRDLLLAQMNNIKVRQIDQEGSLRLETDPDVPIAIVEDRIPVEAEFPDDDGISIRVLLHVLDGRLNELEIYKDDLSPIKSSLRPGEFRLNYPPR